MQSQSTFLQTLNNLGFADEQELHTLVASADLSTETALSRFKDWKKNDGTRGGLVALLMRPGAGAGKQKQPKVERQEVEFEQPETAPPPDPVEFPDTLRSNSYARVIAALCEGEIEGLVDRGGNVLETQAEFGKAIFLDETPLKNENGKANFTGVKVGMTLGTQDQDPITGFGRAEEVIFSGTRVTSLIPVNVGIVNPDADTIIVSVRFPSMLSQDKKTGDIHGSEVRYKVQCSLNSGAFTDLQTVVVKGKSRSAYIKETSHRLPRSETPENDQWVIRVRRLTADSQSLSISNDSYLDFITVVTRNKFRYPNTSIVAIEIDARGFSSIPTLAFRARGSLIKIPNTYYPDTRLYNRDPLTGDPVVDAGGNPVEQVWNGGFYTAWTDNPAWCYFDMMTAPRYGLGEEMGCTPSAPIGNVDKWSLYPIAKYCDELVDDGFGNLEPRFTCNIYMQGREDAFKVMQDFASVCRCMLIWQNGSLQMIQDRPRITPATAFLTLTGNFSGGNTVTIGGKVYTIEASLTNVNGHVKLGASFSESIANLKAAINLETGAGTAYAAATTLHPTVEAFYPNEWASGYGDAANDIAVLWVKSKIKGSSGNSIAVSDTSASASWNASTLSGGLDAIAVFTNANVKDGLFSYTGSAKKARPTQVIVRYNDREDFYRPKFEYVEDTTGILKYGVRQHEVAAFACTSRGQAHRLGRYTLRTNLGETEMISFIGGLELSYMRPGDVFKVLNNDRAGLMQGGRISSIAGDRLSITVDRDVTIPTGTVTLTMTRPQGFIPPESVTDSTQIANMRTSQILEVTLTNSTGTTRVLTFASALPAEVTMGHVWVITTPIVSPEFYRFLGIEEQGPGEFACTGIKYLESKFDATDLDLELEEPDVSELITNPGEVLGVVNLTLTRNAVVQPEGIKLTLEAGWEAPPDAMIESYLVDSRRLVTDAQNDIESATDWVRFEETTGRTSSIPYTVAGIYEVRVASRSTFGVLSDWTVARLDINSANPIELFSITGLELVGNGNIGQGNDTNFIGRDAVFQWRLNSPMGNAEIGSEANGADTGQQDPYFLDYEVTIWDVGTNEMVFREFTQAPHFVYSYTKNSESLSGPRNQFRIEVRGRDKFASVTAPSALIVQNPAPPAPSSLSVISAFKSAYLEWTIAAGVFDLARFDVYMHTADVFASATKVGEVSADTLAFIRSGLNTGTTYYFWLKAVDTFGTASSRYPAGSGVSTTPGSVTATDIANFSVTATKIFTKVVILDADVWTNNSPGAGSIAWNSHTLVYNGVQYAIPSGNTANAYVYWDPANPSSYLTSNTNPISLNTTFFTIATNTSGIYDLAWHALANAVIGSAHIQDLAVTNAKIATLAVEKLLAGTISAKIFQLATNGTGGVDHVDVIDAGTGYTAATATAVGGNGTGATFTVNLAAGNIVGIDTDTAGTGYTSAPRIVIEGDGTGGIAKAFLDVGVEGSIQSVDFVPGSLGWCVFSDGSAEFNDVTVRGKLDAATIYANTVVENSDFPGKPFRTSVVGVMSDVGIFDFENGTAATDEAFIGAGISDTIVRTTKPSELLLGATKFCLVGCAANPTNNYQRCGTDNPEITVHFTCSTHTGEMSLVFRRYPEGHTPTRPDYDYPWRVMAGTNLILGTNDDVVAYVDTFADTYGDTDEAAYNVFTAGANLSNGDTITLNSKVYTIETTLTNVNGHVQRGGSLTATLLNVLRAINLTGTPGTDYAAATTLHPTITATASSATQLHVEAKTAGTGGNALTVSESSGGAWLHTSRLIGGRSPSAADKLEFALVGVQADGTAAASQTVRSPNATFRTDNF